MAKNARFLLYPLLGAIIGTVFSVTLIGPKIEHDFNEHLKHWLASGYVQEGDAIYEPSSNGKGKLFLELSRARAGVENTNRLALCLNAALFAAVGAFIARRQQKRGTSQ